MDKSDSNHRRGKRVEYHFILRARQIGASGPKGAWDVSTVRNLSATGVLFYSSNYYVYDSEVEIKIKNPLIVEEIACRGKIVRCALVENMKDVYSVAVTITEMDRASKEIFDKTIRLFTNKPT